MFSEYKQFYGIDLVKVITGIRRSNKSIILQEIMEEIKYKSDNVIYLNFEKTSNIFFFSGLCPIYVFRYAFMVRRNIRVSG